MANFTRHCAQQVVLFNAQESNYQGFKISFRPQAERLSSQCAVECRANRSAVLKAWHGDYDANLSRKVKQG
ncbi:hypothetical protein RRG08_045787 [Elysia crispata]|uniref:Uncharacterized protein n=1 Tax=Elysia crispata TaxID=231223 RepID=A0AAE1B0T7_9GAST|nr:hypothetical protein RRG08_045787 [Elysia crispata]